MISISAASAMIWARRSRSAREKLIVIQVLSRAAVKPNTVANPRFRRSVLVLPHGDCAFSMAARIWRGVVDLVAPSLCLGCGAGVGEPASLCIACWSALQHLDEPVCDALGTPFAYDQGEGALSAEALSDPPPWDRSRAAVIFDDTSGGWCTR